MSTDNRVQVTGRFESEMLISCNSPEAAAEEAVKRVCTYQGLLFDGEVVVCWTADGLGRPGRVRFAVLSGRVVRESMEILSPVVRHWRCAGCGLTLDTIDPREIFPGQTGSHMRPDASGQPEICGPLLPQG